MRCRSSRRNNHLVSESCLAAQVDRDDVLGFRVFQTL